MKRNSSCLYRNFFCNIIYQLPHKYVFFVPYICYHLFYLIIDYFFCIFIKYMHYVFFYIYLKLCKLCHTLVKSKTKTIFCNLFCIPIWIRKSVVIWQTLLPIGNISIFPNTTIVRFFDSYIQHSCTTKIIFCTINIRHSELFRILSSSDTLIELICPKRTSSVADCSWIPYILR